MSIHGLDFILCVGRRLFWWWCLLSYLLLPSFRVRIKVFFLTGGGDFVVAPARTVCAHIQKMGLHTHTRTRSLSLSLSLSPPLFLSLSLCLSLCLSVCLSLSLSFSLSLCVWHVCVGAKWRKWFLDPTYTHTHTQDEMNLTAYQSRCGCGGW